jgi:hypothetical protein
MKVLLVATNRMMTSFPVYPIGVDYVATALQERHEVRVLDLATDNAEAAVIKRMYQRGRIGPLRDLLVPT